MSAPGGPVSGARPSGDGAASLDPFEIRAWLARVVPDHMVPHAVVVLPELPLTPNGKIDRKALPAPDQAARPPYEAPVSVQELAVAEVLGGVLGTPRVGLCDNFLELGGDSLSAMAVAAQLRTRGMSLSAQSVLASHTVRELALIRPSGWNDSTAPSEADVYPELAIDREEISRLINGSGDQ